MTGPLSPALDRVLAFTGAHLVELVAANSALWALVILGWVLGRFAPRGRR